MTENDDWWLDNSTPKQNNIYPDMERDMQNATWFVDKVKNNDVYAQNLYAAMCNNDFVEESNIWGILKEEYWGVSWRSAGGIVADLQEKGDYLDWYCSGMTRNDGYVPEEVVTEEIRADLKKLGWLVIQDYGSRI